ncbi:MAG: glycoside hydrolase family protein [Clostridia bacterium]|nr:glycoside hydrolase family protein [Clostridia bacterium]
MEEINFGYKAGKVNIALRLDGYYTWDSAVIKADGKYHMFTSRWSEKLGFGWNWVFNSEIVHSVADKPEGPYEFKEVVFPRRGRQFFDGMNTHNTCIKYFNGKFYLYYMGTTYGDYIPNTNAPIDTYYALETWNRKRIGVAVADDINGKFVRRDKPLLEPRDCSHWDCTITTNPSVAIMPDGKTYMLYKSRKSICSPLQIGVAVADKPDGPFERLTENPVLADVGGDIEDPYIWYDAERKKFCLIAKDDAKNGQTGITDEWGSGFYAESDDCMSFKVGKMPKVYSRTVEWADGKVGTQCNLERPYVLFDENGKPTHIFCATGEGRSPYAFEGTSYVLCMKLEEK